MRPVHIELEGFGSYRDLVEVDFSAISLAAIVGPNGSGKSTIATDAIEFALFGVTRGGDIDSVVSDGATLARVSFTFAIGAGEFRATRTRVRGKRTVASFERRIPDGTWEGLCEPQVRTVDDAVRRTLGLDAELLATTVFAGQGDSGRFSAGATPGARKAMLSDIIGLARWVVLADAARSRTQHATSRAATLEQRITQLDTRLATRDADQALHRTLQGRITFLDAELATARTELEQARTALGALTGARELATTLADSITAHDQRINDTRRRHRTDIDDAGRRAATATRDADTARAAADRAAQVAQTVVALETDAARIRRELGDASTRRSDIITGGQTARSDTERHQQAAVAHAQTVAEAGERLAGLERGDGGDCYTCGQPLSDHDRANLAGHLHDTIAQATSAKAAAASAAELADRRRSELRTELTDHDTHTKTLDAALSTVEQHLGAARAAATQHPDLAATAERAAAVATATAVELADLQAVTVADGAAERGVLQQRLDTVRSGLADEPRLIDLERGAARRVHTLDDELTRVRSEHSTVGARLGGYQAIEHERAATETERVDALADTEASKTLARAAGRDGVPALILDGVVAELEVHVNAVLDQLANSMLSVRLITQRTTKAGTLSETLDIVVYDAAGTERPYETFSGSEKLRIDVALRVGLSRLLAHRSGTPIKMLVFDETWGALDADGVQAMVDCLRRLSGEYDCVLTVTHDAAVASAFPLRIEVRKGPMGSEIDVVA